MNFFRKHFVTAVLVCLGLVGVAMLIPYLKGDGKENTQIAQEIKEKEVEIPFSHQGNLEVLNADKQKVANFEIEFAQGEQQTALGLMFRYKMEENRGMLFIFPEEEMRSFWMKNTYIPLDIIYISAEKQIVSIYKNAPALSLDSRPSTAPAMYVLEVNAGICDKLNIKEGDFISFEKN